MKRVPWVAAAVLAGLLLAASAVGAQRIDKATYGMQWVDDILIAAAQRILSTMPADGHQIEPAALDRLLKQGGPVLLDVRSLPQWKLERVLGATHIPLPELVARVDLLPANRDAEIVVFCQDGTRGTVAMTVLRMLGYTNVRNLRGGLNAWSGNGFVVNNQVVK